MLHVFFGGFKKKMKTAINMYDCNRSRAAAAAGATEQLKTEGPLILSV
jgi:hypothetical protein